MSSRAQVLVVDDEYALRRLLRTYLEKEGFAVLEAENGHDALRLVRAGNVDAALIDVMLPGLDGFELVRRIHQESTIPLILLTARGEGPNRVAGLEVGANDYVVKPFSAPEVVARVRAQLRRAQGFEGAFRRRLVSAHSRLIRVATRQRRRPGRLAHPARVRSAGCSDELAEPRLQTRGAARAGVGFRVLVGEDRRRACGRAAPQARLRRQDHRAPRRRLQVRGLMFARLTSLRFWLVLAMLSAALVGLTGAYVSYGRIQSSQERAADRAKDEASPLRSQRRRPRAPTADSSLRGALPYNQLIIIRNGRTSFTGPPLSRPRAELSVTAPFNGGRVILRDYESPKRDAPIAFTLVAAGVILLVILAALAAATMVTRAVRGPIERAVAAAEPARGRRLQRANRALRAWGSRPGSPARSIRWPSGWPAPSAINAIFSRRRTRDRDSDELDLGLRHRAHRRQPAHR